MTLHFVGYQLQSPREAKFSFFMTVKLYEELILTDRSNTANWLMFFWLPNTSDTCFEKACSLKNTMKWPKVFTSLIFHSCLCPASIYIMPAGRMTANEWNTSDLINNAD